MGGGSTIQTDMIPGVLIIVIVKQLLFVYTSYSVSSPSPIWLWKKIAIHYPNFIFLLDPFLFFHDLTPCLQRYISSSWNTVPSSGQTFSSVPKVGGKFQKQAQLFFPVCFLSVLRFLIIMAALSLWPNLANCWNLSHFEPRQITWGSPPFPPILWNREDEMWLGNDFLNLKKSRRRNSHHFR